jgi:hypothetical protein
MFQFSSPTLSFMKCSFLVFFFAYFIIVSFYYFWCLLFFYVNHHRGFLRASIIFSLVFYTVLYNNQFNDFCFFLLYFLSALALYYHSFSKFLKWNFRLLIYSLFLIQGIVSFPLSSSVASSPNFSYVLFLFSPTQWFSFSIEFCCFLFLIVYILEMFLGSQQN